MVRLKGQASEDQDRNPFDDPETVHDDPAPDRGPPATPDSTTTKETNPPLWRVFLPQDAIEHLDEAESQVEFGKGQDRLDWLRKIAQDPEGGMRPLLLPTSAQMRALETVFLSAPHFAKLFNLVLPCLGAARQTGRAFSLPPILLTGPPGVGKTHIARELARAIGMTAVSVSMPNQSTTNIFAGRDLGWKSPSIGLIARALIAGGSASPLMILDEIDKAAGRMSEYGDPLGPLHDLLEPSTAQSFEDELLKLRIDASKVCWIATANDLAPVPPSLLDRFILIDVRPPSEEQMILVLESLYRDLLGEWGTWFSRDLPNAIASALRKTHPRKARQTLFLAMTLAAHENRHTLDEEDIGRAAHILDHGERRQRFGFI